MECCIVWITNKYCPDFHTLAYVWEFYWTFGLFFNKWISPLAQTYSHWKLLLFILFKLWDDPKYILLENILKWDFLKIRLFPCLTLLNWMKLKLFLESIFLLICYENSIFSHLIFYFIFYYYHYFLLYNIVLILIYLHMVSLSFLSFFFFNVTLLGRLFLLF